MTTTEVDRTFARLLAAADEPTVRALDPGLSTWLAQSEPLVRSVIRKALAQRASEIRVVEYVDFFRLHDAPYELEERMSESGHTYTRKVYLPEAYAEPYMVPSDETGRLVRWGVRLADGRIVSRDGVFRLRAPEQWARIRGLLARKRGDARDAAAALALWNLLDPTEHEAMLESLALASYLDGRGANQAEQDVIADLKESGSLLYYVFREGRIAPPLSERIANGYSTKYLGGPVGSPEWRRAPWPAWVMYKTQRAGAPIETTDPEKLPLTRVLRQQGRAGPFLLRVPHPWWASLREFATAEHPGVEELRAALIRRLGGPVTTWQDTEGLSSLPHVRRDQMVHLDARAHRMRPEDLAEMAGADRYKLLPAMLRALWSMTRA